MEVYKMNQIKIKQLDKKISKKRRAGTRDDRV